MASGLERVAIGLMALSMRLDAIAIQRGLTMDAKWDESKHPRQPDGRFGSGESVSTVQGDTVLIGHGDKKPIFLPTTTTKSHDKHHEGHAREMGIDFKQWKQEAAALLNRPPTPDLLDWYDEEENTYYRFDKKTRHLVTGDIRGTINTYFVLKKNKYKSYIPEKYLAELK